MQASPNLNNYTIFLVFTRFAQFGVFSTGTQSGTFLFWNLHVSEKDFGKKETALEKLHPCFAVVWS